MQLVLLAVIISEIFHLLIDEDFEGVGVKAHMHQKPKIIQQLVIVGRQCKVAILKGALQILLALVVAL